MLRFTNYSNSKNEKKKKYETLTSDDHVISNCCGSIMLHINLDTFSKITLKIFLRVLLK